MVGLPWFLLAAGLALVLVGALMGGLPGRTRRGRRAIRPRMRDADIAEELNATEPVRAADLVVSAGLACVAVSVAWRLLRAVL